MTEKPSILYVEVQGVKSIYDRAKIEIKPLTLFAGANSSGKSSVMQPLLLMKQTLDAEFDTFGLLLNGSHTKFTDATQLFNDYSAQDYFPPSDEIKQKYSEYMLKSPIMIVAIQYTTSDSFTLTYTTTRGDRLIAPVTTQYWSNDSERVATLGAFETHDEIVDIFGEEIDELRTVIEQYSQNPLKWKVLPSKGFLQLAIVSEDDTQVTDFGNMSLKVFPIGVLKNLIQEIIHVPGLRGNPQRSYPVTTMDFSRFEGTFLPYTASVIQHWQESDEEADKAKLEKLVQQLRDLNLTAYVSTQAIDDTQTEVRVGRTLSSAQDDTVSLADVGFGVSQVLPVLVALLVAKKGQLVYLEQPELHLHPRAQVALAQIIADASNRGVRVVVETHSSLLLIGIQTLIAEGKLKPDDTILHWFMRDADGKTTVDSQTPDENGAYGDWQEDFADVELDAQGRYIKAVAHNQLSTEAGD